MTSSGLGDLPRKEPSLVSAAENTRRHCLQLAADVHRGTGDANSILSTADRFFAYIREGKK